MARSKRDRDVLGDRLVKRNWEIVPVNRLVASFPTPAWDGRSRCTILHIPHVVMQNLILVLLEFHDLKSVAQVCLSLHQDAVAVMTFMARTSIFSADEDDSLRVAHFLSSVHVIKDQNGQMCVPTKRNVRELFYLQHHHVKELSIIGGLDKPFRLDFVVQLAKRVHGSLTNMLNAKRIKAHKMKREAESWEVLQMEQQRRKDLARSYFPNCLTFDCGERDQLLYMIEIGVGEDRDVVEFAEKAEKVYQSHLREIQQNEARIRMEMARRKSELISFLASKGYSVCDWLRASPILNSLIASQQLSLIEMEAHVKNYLLSLCQEAVLGLHQMEMFERMMPGVDMRYQKDVYTNNLHFYESILPK